GHNDNSPSTTTDSSDVQLVVLTRRAEELRIERFRDRERGGRYTLTTCPSVVTTLPHGVTRNRPHVVIDERTAFSSNLRRLMRSAKQFVCDLFLSRNCEIKSFRQLMSSRATPSDTAASFEVISLGKSTCTVEIRGHQ
ncbi:hypothetical protein ALC60_07863, partial [Trachymyrmex zeteki]